MMLSRGTPASTASRSLSRSSSITAATTSSYAASAYIVFDEPRECIRISAAPDSATACASAGSRCRPLTSLTSVAPAEQAARATSAL